MGKNVQLNCAYVSSGYVGLHQYAAVNNLAVGFVVTAASRLKQRSRFWMA